jgi:hypothetical protein
MNRQEPAQASVLLAETNVFLFGGLERKRA